MKTGFRIHRISDQDQERHKIAGRGITPADTSTGLGGGPALGAAGTGEPEATDSGVIHGETSWENYVGFRVVDSHQQDIGRLSGIWTDQSGQPAYLGVRTFWFGKTHVFPAEVAQADATRECIRVPFDSDSVREAPTFAPDEELDIEDERSIREYFSAYGYQRR